MRLARVVPAFALAAVAGIGTASSVASAPTGIQARDQQNAAIDASDLQLAATAIVDQAVSSGALPAAPDSLGSQPAGAIMSALYATLAQARVTDPSLDPVDTRAIMGPVPYNLSHQLHPRARHRHITLTHTLHLFEHAVSVGLSHGLGLDHRHDGVTPSRPQASDGVYVNPVLPELPDDPSVAMVAIRAAMTRLGDPYVWAAAGPNTFDCSGLVRWAYGKAGLSLLHYTGYQWNEGRLVAPRDVLPGDLVLFYKDLGHVGIYLGAGWMLNAPFTGQYVNVVPVHGKVAGIVRP
jgi:cell wall-associated NlpC family hydrolase